MSPETGQYSDAPTDGEYLPVYGPRVRPGTTIAVEACGALKLCTQTAFDGRVIRRNTLTVSRDGRTLSEESWMVANPSERDVLLYNK